MFAKNGTRLTKYSIKDNFLRFWFKFVYPYQDLIESGQWRLLRENIEKNYADFSGLALERLFREKLMESGNFTSTGNWWDKTSGNEIDIIAVNEFSGTGLICEVKRNAKKIIAKIQLPSFLRIFLMRKGNIFLQKKKILLILRLI